MENDNNKKGGSKIIVILFLIIILLIAIIGFGIVYFMFPNILPGAKNKQTSKTETNTIYSNIIEENTISDFESNSLIDVENTTKPQNETDGSTVIDLSTEKKDVEINQEELKTLIEQYGVGIQRIDNEFETMEGNTALLLIAKKFFDTNTGSSSLKIDSKYAQTAENYHKYLSELTKTNYNDVESISSFSNYIGYSKNSKSYILGKNSSTLTKEHYTCTAVDVIDKTDDINTGRAIVTRTIDDVKTVYQLTFKFKVNQDYEYQKYKILSLNAVNSSGKIDDTVHLVAN